MPGPREPRERSFPLCEGFAPCAGSCCSQASREMSPARITHRDRLGDLGGARVLSGHAQLEAEGATVRNSLSVFLEDAAVSEQSEEPL